MRLLLWLHRARLWLYGRRRVGMREYCEMAHARYTTTPAAALASASPQKNHRTITQTPQISGLAQGCGAMATGLTGPAMGRFCVGWPVGETRTDG